MRVLAFSDVHGSIEMVERVLVLERTFDLIVLAGDITTAGTTSEITKAIERVSVFRKPVAAIAGNMDPLPLERTLKRLGVSIDSSGAVYGNAGFFGVSGCPESPMRTPNELSEREIMDRAEAGWKSVAAARWKIFVPHTAPHDTLLDLTHSGIHAGSTAVRDFVLRRKPDAVICGHIHEACGMDTVGGVPAINCGPAGKGRYAVVTIGESIAMENRSLR